MIAGMSAEAVGEELLREVREEELSEVCIIQSQRVFTNQHHLDFFFSC